MLGSPPQTFLGAAKLLHVPPTRPGLPVKSSENLHRFHLLSRIARPASASGPASFPLSGPADATGAASRARSAPHPACSPPVVRQPIARSAPDPPDPVPAPNVKVAQLLHTF